jgi:outer membrane protein OmpA-like peptidoglycan-associated protein
MLFRATLFVFFACLPVLIFAQSAPSKLISASDIISALDDDNITRGMGTKRPRLATVPDAQTRSCDPQAQRLWEQTVRNTAEQVGRNLAVLAAPSIDLDVRFNFADATLLPDGMQQLDALATALKNPRLLGVRFLLAGHTDQKGTAEYNDRLSCERALSSRNYLRDKHGIGAERLLPLGFGFLRLKEPTAPLSEINRRVEVRRFEAN